MMRATNCLGRSVPPTPSLAIFVSSFSIVSVSCNTTPSSMFPLASVHVLRSTCHHAALRCDAVDTCCQDLAKELMAREPPATQRNVSTVDRSRRRPSARTLQAQDAKARKDNKRALHQVRFWAGNHRDAWCEGELGNAASTASMASRQAWQAR